VAEKQVKRKYLNCFKNSRFILFLRLVATYPKETLHYINKIQSDSTFKGVSVQFRTRSMYFNQFRSRENQYQFLKKTLLTAPIVMLARKDFFLFDALNEKINLLTAGGLIEYWDFEGINKILVDLKDEGEAEIFIIASRCWKLLCSYHWIDFKLSCFCL
jgi:hypothetical protein